MRMGQRRSEDRGVRQLCLGEVITAKYLLFARNIREYLFSSGTRIDSNKCW